MVKIHGEKVLNLFNGQNSWCFSLYLKPRGASNTEKGIFKVLVNKYFSVLFG